MSDLYRPRHNQPTRRRVSRAAAAAVLLLGGCNGDADPLPAPTTTPATAGIECQAKHVFKAAPVPTNFNIERLAEKLGVDKTAVAAGALLEAECVLGIPAAEVGEGTVVTITGIPESSPVVNRCLAIISDTPNGTAHHIGALCPAQ